MNYQDTIVNEELNIREALKLLDLSGKKTLFVIRNNKLVGAVSDGDVRRWILKNGDLNEPIKTIMNENPTVVMDNDKIKATKMMKKQGISAVPLLNINNEIEDIFFWVDEEDISCRDSLNAKVVIMAGGKGERLLPYTSVVPKPLIPIGDKPIIELIIDSFIQHGCNDFSLTLNYKKNMIKAYFDELERDYKINYIEEDRPLGTGGSLYFLKDQVENTFFVSNCDILLNVNYSEIYKHHNKNKNLITVITSLKHFVIPYGTINTNQDGSLKSLVEKPCMDYLINTGVYLLEPMALNLLKENEFMHITDLIQTCIESGEKVGTYPISEEAWMDMGQFEDLGKMKLRLQG